MTHRITTPDPTFDPGKPVEINGYLFVPVSIPVRQGAKLLRSGDYMWQSERNELADMIDPPRPKGWPAPGPQPDRTAKRYVAPPREGFAEGYTPRPGWTIDGERERAGLPPLEDAKEKGRDPYTGRPRTTLHCQERTEGDEKVCASCGLRWPSNEERPACPK